MSTCPDCGVNLPSNWPECYRCIELHQRLVERLLEGDDAAGLAEIASRALHGFEVKRERRWMIG